jgi:hypothetical protein
MAFAFAFIKGGLYTVCQTVQIVFVKLLFYNNAVYQQVDLGFPGSFTFPASTSSMRIGFSSTDGA